MWSRGFFSILLAMVFDVPAYVSNIMSSLENSSFVGSVKNISLGT